ncbi:MAG: hypothetical protein AABW52_05010 [Nanoarchaeota archaeon]
MGIRNYILGITAYSLISLASACGSDNNSSPSVVSDISDLCLDDSKSFAVVQNILNGSDPHEFCFGYYGNVLENLASCVESANVDGSYICRATKGGAGLDVDGFIDICSSNILAPVKHVDNSIEYECAKFEPIEDL